MTNEQQKTIKQLLIWLPIVIILVILLVERSCNRATYVTPKATTVTIQPKQTGDRWHRVADDWKFVAKVESEKVKASVEKHYHYYNSTYTTMPDTCKPFLAAYKRLRDNTDSLYDKVILVKNKAIAAQDSSNKEYRKQISKDSVDMAIKDKVMADTVKVLNKAIKRRGFKRFVQGMAVGAVIVEGLNVVKTLKP